MPPAVFLYHRRRTWSSGKNAWTRPRKIEGCRRVLSSATSPTKSPTLISGSSLAGWWLGPATSASAGPSSAFRLANSSAIFFLSLAVRRSYVFWACSLECRRQAARLSFMRSSHSLKTEERTQTVISGVAIVFQSNRFQKFRGGGGGQRRNLHAAPSPGSVWWCYWWVSGIHHLYGDVQFNSDADLPLRICPGYERGPQPKACDLVSCQVLEHLL